jgi:DNA-binding NarL/FixJ family response regulator
MAVEWRRRIVVVEDEKMVASLLHDAFSQQGFDAVIGHDALEARHLVETQDPDAALIDINLGSGPSGLQFGQWLHRTHPQVALIFLSRHVDPRSSGAEQWDVPPNATFLSKDRITNTAVLVDAVEMALRQINPAARHDLEDRSQLAQLTAIQNEILHLAAQGLTNSAIAAKRGTSERTVEQRLQAVYETLGISISPDINPRVQAIRMFIEAGGLIRDTESFT